MSRWFINHYFRNKPRGLVKLLGLLIIASSFVLLTAASQKIVLTTEQEVGGNWRTSYDILVRPPGAVGAVEAEDGLVRANYLSGIYGGISIEQYEAIKNLPDVEVAAPIALIGYLTTEPKLIFELQDGNLYKVDRRVESSDGVFQYIKEDETYFLKRTRSNSPDVINFEEYIAFVERLHEEGLVTGVDAGSLSPGPQNFFLLAGVDPESEAQLLDFSEAVVKGRLLSSEDLIVEEGGFEVTLRTGETFDTFYWFPLLINAHIYEQQTAYFQVAIVEAPEQATLQQKVYEDGREYLRSIPLSEQLFSQEVDLGLAYDWVFETLQRGGDSLPPDHGIAEAKISPFGGNDFQQPTAVTYRDHPGLASFEHDTVLEAIPLDVADDGQVLFRDLNLLEYKNPHNFRIKGTFDMAEIRDPYSTRLNEVPLEMYYPPLAARLYDDAGRAVDPSLLIPTLNAQGYLLRPPYALTTLEAACIIAGDGCISAIRLRVKGVEEMDERSQAKIDEVAKQIYELTGLHVDIMLGSSPRFVLVGLPGFEGNPGVGFVEEGWVQKGVSISIFRGFNKADLAFFTATFLVFAVYVAQSSQLAALSRRRELGLLTALGWRRVNITRLLLQESAVLATVAGVLALGLSLAAIKQLKLESGMTTVLFSLPLCLGVYLAGSLLPALNASRSPPISSLRRGELHLGARRLGGQSLGGYAIRGLLHRRSRTLLTLLCVGVSTGLVSFFIGVSLSMDGYLYGTLLGEHVSLQIEGYHYAMAGLCFAASALAIFDTMLMNAIERRQEIAILKAFGWRSRDILRSFILEASILGFAGGVLGWIAGTIGSWVFQGAVVIGPIWLGLLALSLPTLVSIIAGFYPSLVAARTPPVAIAE